MWRESEHQGQANAIRETLGIEEPPEQVRRGGQPMAKRPDGVQAQYDQRFPNGARKSRAICPVRELGRVLRVYLEKCVGPAANRTGFVW